MSDDLIKQWDEYVESMGSVMGEVEHMAQQMRDRIEQLERERDHVIEDSNNMFSAMSANLEAAEAKFAKAVEALRDIAGSVPYADNPWHIALAALAELEGK